METKSVSKKLITTREQSRNKPNEIETPAVGLQYRLFPKFFNLIYNFAAHQNSRNKSSNDKNTDYNQTQGK